jgi:hypothetical protein
MRLDTQAIVKTVQQDWSALLSSLDADARPMVVTTACAPFQIVAVNGAWTSLCGFSAQEALGGSLKMIQGPHTDRTTVSAMSALLATTTSRPCEFELVNYTKAKRPFLNRVSVDRRNIVAADGAILPMFVGALSFKEWVPTTAPTPRPPPTAAATRSIASFSLAESLAHSAKPSTASRRSAGAVPTINLAALAAAL